MKMEKNSNSITSKKHKRFTNVAEYVRELGGDKTHVIEKVLIANNGVGAVKAIRSIRRWAYDIFGDEKAIQFVVMATPEDLRANAEYIRMADVIVDVPGGSNNHNYANVTLIVEIARLHGVHAVWAGWGHASENPVLPDTLAKSTPPIKFIGPSGPPMRALGDKIGSTIIAQTAGVPCIAWNGDGIIAEYDKNTGSLPEHAYRQASISSATEAFEAAARIGFPIMIKASEGGGGKGIRMVSREEDVANAYRQVCGEVPGSPIFIMKLSTKSRHLEVQLLADEYGNAVALNGRDCSVQRRHQKIIEEGPPIAAPPDVWNEMEKAAISLAKAVGYANAGTVEYLYSESDQNFYFLELNPRLQVEHPVTEMVTKVNLPACQLQVAMGIKLYNIPDIRNLYGKHRFEEKYDDSAIIDFDNETRMPAYGHCIAVRITAENAEAGFKPTSGGIQELNFRSTPSVWGYFSMDSSGSIHEYADSQFGHLFASGNDREEARRNMVLALKELSIRGDISTTVDYISKLIELEDFVNNDIDTGWLDQLIKENVDGIGAQVVIKRSISTTKISSVSNDVSAVIGSLIIAYDSCIVDEDQFLTALNKGQLPSQSLLSMERKIDLILNGIKYKLSCVRVGPTNFRVSVTGKPDAFVLANIRRLSDGGYLTDIGGKSRVAYMTSKGDAASGMRITIGGINISFSSDYDPTSLRTDVAGKLVKKLVPDGAHLSKGDAYCEIEVMKMFMPLKVSEAGIISWRNNEGAALSPGDLIATLALDHPDNVATATIFEGDLDVDGWNTSSRSTNSRPHLILRKSIESLNSGLSGFALNRESIRKIFDNIFEAVSDPLLPIFEINDPLSVLHGRLDASLYQSLSAQVTDFRHLYENGSRVTQFSAKGFLDTIQKHKSEINDPSEQKAFSALVSPLVEVVTPYVNVDISGVPGSERVLQIFLQILRKWIEVERWFCDDRSYADVVDALRKANKENSQHVLEVCRSHAGLESSSEIIVAIIEIIADALQTDINGKGSKILLGAKSLGDAVPCLSEIGSMTGAKYSSVALRARKVLLQESKPSAEERTKKIFKIMSVLEQSTAQDLPSGVKSFVDENVPIADIFFPILSSQSEHISKLLVLELYFRKLYRSQSLKTCSRDVDSMTFQFTFCAKPTERFFSATTPVTSMTDLTRAISRSGSLCELGDATDRLLPPNTPRAAVCKLESSLNEVLNISTLKCALSSFPQSRGDEPRCPTGPANILYIVVTEEINAAVDAMDILSKRIENLLELIQSELHTADIRRVSFILNGKMETASLRSQVSVSSTPLLPSILTYRNQLGFKEDSLFRNIEPGYAYLLDLSRLSKNFQVKLLDSSLTSTVNVHMYKATPREEAVIVDKNANRMARIFVRAVSFISEFTSTQFEKILVDSLNALDIVVYELGIRVDNHLFINLVSDYESYFVDPVSIEQIMVTILKRHGDRITALGIKEVETKLLCSLSSGSPPIALRMVASNPTGYVHVMSTYIEAENESGSTPVFKSIGGTKASLSSSGDSSWEGLKITTPYPLTRPFDAQRSTALRSSDSLYCYDLPALFEAAVEQQWSDAASKGGIEGGIRAAARPMMVMYTSELVVERKDGSDDPWSMRDYLNGELRLSQSQRRAGSNNVGMVAWLMTLKTIEYPNGRQIVLIANDITFKAGSFGTREDVVFKMASEFARQHGYPRLYVAANSGARIGLAESVKKLFKIAFKDPLKPENGFDFLYVTKADYQAKFSENKHVLVEPAIYNGQDVLKITDIIGAEPDLGVENLKGSGLIAGETSTAYEEIFTMSIILGRTVGIGAYLVRLGQRTIQKVTSSPIILTGYQALNKLMGVDVYSTNDQLGGPSIMYSNGVSHLTANDHLEAIKSAIQWLSFVPSVRGGLLPISDMAGIDDFSRKIQFCPSPGVPYDPRMLITGTEDDDGNWISGFFDRGSFTESLAGWAKSVIVGRARLGGIPMGVIATENRTVEAIKPADPADVKAIECVKQEAGGVWFPNSAYKTAQAINDFRTEDLPLLVFANWRGFSGGQRDMFDEVLKYGSMIVDAFVAYEQPVFVFIPPFAEIRGGAWVVLDASINASVMEMYATKGTARGNVLEANGAASVKYREKDLLQTMRRVDEKLIDLYSSINSSDDAEQIESIRNEIKKREKSLLPVYEQIAVQFCELHDTPGRMKAVGVIEREVEWADARSFFLLRLRRKLAEFDLRKKMIKAGNVGRRGGAMTPVEASAMIQKWFISSTQSATEEWKDDNKVLAWMAQNNADLESKIAEISKQNVAEEVYSAIMSGGETAKIGTAGIFDGISRAMADMSEEQRTMIKDSLKLLL